MATFIDLSHDVHDGLVTYPGLPAVQVSTVLSREDSRGRYAAGTEFFIGSIELCANTGTYLDTPYHRYAEGHDLTGLDLARCADLPAVVLAPGNRAIGPDDLDVDVDGCAVLLKTGWDQRWGTPRYFDPDHGYLTEAGARHLVSCGAALVGIDALNIDSTAGNERPAHSVLLAAGIPIVEHLTNLAAVPVLGARFTAVPVKVAGLGTFPVRAFAAIPDRPAVCEVVFDCADVRVLATFWRDAMGAGSVQVQSDDWASVRDPRPGGLKLGFQRVPEGKAAKNRVHIDLWSDDIAADTARLVAAGARVQGPVVAEADGEFQVLLDPEGNELCLVRDF